MTTSEVIAWGIGGFGVLGAIIAYFLRQKDAAIEARFVAFDAKFATMAADNLAAKEAMHSLKDLLTSKIDGYRDKVLGDIAEMNRRIDSVTRASATDSHEGDGKIREEFKREIRDLQQQLLTIRDEMLRWQAGAGEKYLTKNEFIRDNTMLDTRISSMNHTVKNVQLSIDRVLSRYLKELSMSNTAVTARPKTGPGAKFNGHATLTVLESPREDLTELADSSHPYGEQLAMMDETQRGLEDILVKIAIFEEREFNHNSGVYKVKVK